MNFRDRSRPVESGFQIAPMIDIVFLLLIFFIVTWNFARWESEIEVQVPSAQEGDETRRAVGEIIVNVRADGVVVVNRREMDAEQLLGTLERIASLYPDQAVILRGDQSVEYKHIVEVLDICRQANIWNVAFATSRPETP